MNDQLFTVEEVSKQLKVTRQTVYNWITAGKLDVIRAGRSIRISASAVERFLVQQGDKAAAED
jgi:excisionase family DNA binding protein